MRYGLWSVVCLLVSVPLAIGLLRRRSARPPIEVVRFATFDTGLSRGGPGQLLRELQSAAATATAIAEIVQRNDVDVLLVSGLDVDEAAATVAVLRDDYLGKAQGNLTPIRFEYTFTGAVNCVPSGVDLDHDGKTDGPGDAFAAGAFAGQHGMALLSRYPILLDRVRTLQQLPWAAMPMALRPDGCSDAAWAQLRLSATSHWDVPIQVRADGMTIHVLCSAPVQPAHDGPEHGNARRNHDEIRLWADYLTPGSDGWIVDDQGRHGGLAAGEHCVVLGDLNGDPQDGDSEQHAIRQLLEHPRLQDPKPRSDGAVVHGKRVWGANAAHRGDPALDTCCDESGKDGGNLRLDYVLPSRSLPEVGAGVYWPAPPSPAFELVRAARHRLVWVDVRVH